MTQLHFQLLTEELLSTTYPNGRLMKWADVIDAAKRGKLVVAVCDKENILEQMRSYFTQFVGKDNIMMAGEGQIMVRNGWGGVIFTSSHPGKDVLCYKQEVTFYYIYEEDQQWRNRSKNS